MIENVTSSTGESRRLSGNLTVRAIVFMVVAAAAPLTVIAGVVPIGFAFGNGAGFPAMYVLVAVMLLLFAVGFTAMTRHIPRPGAFFTYIAHGLGRPLGLGAAYAAILCYMAVELGVLGYIGAELNSFVNQYLGLDVPWVLFTALAILMAGWLGYRHVELSAKVLAVLLTLELSIVMVISIIAVAKGGATGLDLESFKPSSVTSGAPSLALMFAAASFIGFEATAIFRDEAVRPEKTVPRATFAAVIVVGLFYAFTSWAFVMAWGSGNIVERASTDPAFLFSTANAQIGEVGEVVTHILVLTSIFAAILAFHTITTRYVHALSRVGLLPSAMSRLSPRDNAPCAASLTVSITGAILVLASLAAGLEPYLEMFTWFVGLGALIYILLLATCTLAVIVYFARNPVVGESLWATRLAPSLALVCLLYSAYTTGDNFPLLVGDVDEAGSPALGTLSVSLLVAIVVAVGVGLVQANTLRSRGSQAYDDIVRANIGE